MEEVYIDLDLNIKKSNSFFVENIIPKNSVGYCVKKLFNENDFCEFENILEKSRINNEHFVMENVEVYTFSLSEFPLRKLYNIIISYTNFSYKLTFIKISKKEECYDKKQLQDFLNKAPIALHSVSEEGKFLWVNDRELELLGYSREELIGESILNFTLDHKSLLSVFDRLKNGENIHNETVKFKTKTGEVRTILLDSNYHNENDGTGYTRCFLQDQSSYYIKKHKSEQLELAESILLEKSKFVSRLLHEIKTPLHVIKTILSLEEINNELIRIQVDNLSRLVDNMSSAVSFDKGDTIPDNMEICDMYLFFSNYEKPPHITNEIVLVKNIDIRGSNKKIDIDICKVKSAIDEILSFCILTEPIKEVVFNVKREYEDSPIHIQILFDKKIKDLVSLQNLFHSYWVNLPGAELTDNSCLNLGLNVAFNYIQCIGSNLSVGYFSDKTCFSFTINHKNTNKLKKPVYDYESYCSEYKVKPKNILLVEDNTICQRMTKKLLEKLGHTCEIASNGSIGVDIIKSSSDLYDAILMDIRMPIMDGIEAASKIREIYDKPIIAFTAEDHFDITGSDFSHIIHKPASIKDIKKVFSVYNL